jgi:hypothetical protein
MTNLKLILAALITAAALTGNAQAYTIDDNYIGADPTHGRAHTDVIGEQKYYNIDGMNVSTAGKFMSVDIVSSFVAKTSSTTIWDERTHIGDLFIGTGGWKPFGTAADKYQGDKVSTTGTLWDYVVVLTPHIPTVSQDPVKNGQAVVYATRNGNFVKSNLGGLNENSWVYRADQYVQFTPNAGAAALATGTWDITDNVATIAGNTYGSLNIDFDYTTISPVGKDWAFHWGMTCANDIIEGQTEVFQPITPQDFTPVPEPSTFMLLGVGLLGAGLARRKYRK